MEDIMEAGEDSKRRISKHMCIATIFASLGSFLFGFHTGGISSAIPLIKYRIDLDHVWQESIVSITIGAAAFASPLGGTIADFFGRKFAIQCSSVLFLLGAAAFIAANEKTMLLLSRMLLGVATGFTCASVPLYIAECSPARARGILLSLNSVFITGGNFVSNFLCAAFSSYIDNGWRIAFAFSCLPPIAQLIAFCYLPESPLWYMDHGRLYDAREALRRLRPNAAIAAREYALLEAKNEQDESQFLDKGKPTICSMLRDSKLFGLFLVGWSLFAFQQICGINAVLYYSATLIQMAGVNALDSTLWLAAVSSGIYFVCTALSLPLVKRFRRRVLVLVSLLMVFVSLSVIASGFHFVSVTSPPVTVYETTDKSAICGQLTTCDSCIASSRCGFCYAEYEKKPFFVNGSCVPRMKERSDYASTGRCSSMLKSVGKFSWATEWCPSYYAWIPVVGLLLYVLSFAPGLGVMPWIINAELYPQCVRSAGIAMATTVNFIFNLIVTLPFLTTVDYVGKAGTFCLMAVASLIGFVLFFLFLPETSGKHLLNQSLPTWPSASEDNKKLFNRRRSFSDSATFRYMRIRGHNHQFYNEDDVSE